MGVRSKKMKIFFYWTFSQSHIGGYDERKICFVLAVFSCLSFKEDGQSFISGGILERRICWIACSQVLRKPQGTEKSTLCKRDVQLQQAEPQLRFCQSSEQIFSLLFPSKQPARVVPTRHPAWGAQLQWEVERIDNSLSTYFQILNLLHRFPCLPFFSFQVSISFSRSHFAFAGANWTSSSQMSTARELTSWLKR